MSGSFQVLSDGILRFHALKRLLELSNKFKNGHKKCLPRKISREKSLNFKVLAYLSKKSQNHGNPSARKIVMTVLKFDD
jgi:hypothetical protein